MVLVLRESSGRRRWLPIVISPEEGKAISDAHAAASLPRSGPLGLLTTILDALDRPISRIELTGLHGADFVAELVFDNGRRAPARPADAVALALGAEPTTPVLVTEHLLDATGATGATGEPRRSDEPVDRGDHDDQIRRFRAFLDAVAPEDFDDGRR
nr:bifunctional nuclease domain-containing protein [Pseudonocardia acidicola]